MNEYLIMLIVFFTFSIVGVAVGVVASCTRIRMIDKTGTTQKKTSETIVSRQAAMNACDFVIDIMMKPKFWSSINSSRLNTPEHALQFANASEHDRPLRIYYPMPCLNATYQQLQSQLKRPIEIVSNTGDETLLPDAFEQLSNHALIHTLYLNNVPLDFKGHPKVKYIPIGYTQDEFYRKRLTDRMVLEIDLKSVPLLSRFSKNHAGMNALDAKPVRKLSDKALKVLVAFGNTGSQWTKPHLRRECREFLTEKSFGAVFPMMEKKEYFAKHEEYAFELSPFGNGLDCFRHWECMLLHCIPIVFHSPVDSVFKDLPVVLIDDVRELNEDRLARELHRWADYFETHDIQKELSMNRWLEPAF